MIVELVVVPAQFQTNMKMNNDKMKRVQQTTQVYREKSYLG